MLIFAKLFFCACLVFILAFLGSYHLAGEHDLAQAESAKVQKVLDQVAGWAVIFGIVMLMALVITW